jgi:hypothetical protein
MASQNSLADFVRKNDVMHPPFGVLYEKEPDKPAGSCVCFFCSRGANVTLYY